MVLQAVRERDRQIHSQGYLPVGRAKEERYGAISCTRVWSLDPLPSSLACGTRVGRKIWLKRYWIVWSAMSCGMSFLPHELMRWSCNLLSGLLNRPKSSVIISKVVWMEVRSLTWWWSILIWLLLGDSSREIQEVIGCNYIWYVWYAR